MTRASLSTTVAAIAAGVALVAGPAVGHAEPPPTTLHLEGAYAYVDKPQRPNNTRNIMVIFKMGAPLGDRSTSVDGGGQQSIAYPGRRCFYMIAGRKGRKLGPKGKVANYGTRHTLRVSAFDGPDGTRPAVVATSFTIQRNGSKAAARKKLGC